MRWDSGAAKQKETLSKTVILQVWNIGIKYVIFHDKRFHTICLNKYNVIQIKKDI